MSKKANYPEWVMKHKKKGTYINKVGDKYYLYAAHSERVPGTNKVRRVSDGYIGRITEADGLIPTKDKVLDVLITYEIGVSYAITTITSDLCTGLKRSFPKYGEIIYACAVLFYIYGEYNKELFEASHLCLQFPNILYPSAFTKAQITGIERGIRMISERVPGKFGDDLPQIISYFSNIRLVKVNKNYYLPHLLPTVIDLSKKYEIDWSSPLWQK